MKKKLPLLLFLAGLFSLQLVIHAITLDGSFVTDLELSSATVTRSFTVGAGPNRMLAVGFITRVSSSSTHSSCTFGGVALTKAVEAEEGQFAQAVASIWYLPAPAVSTADVVCTCSTTAVWGTVGIVALEGVDQVSPLGDTDVETPSMNVSTLAFNALTTTGANSFVFDAFQSFAGSDWTMDAETNRVQRLLDVSQGDNAGFSTINPKATAGAVTMQWSFGAGSSDGLLVGAEFTAAASVGQSRSLLQVGR